MRALAGGHDRLPRDVRSSRRQVLCHRPREEEDVLEHEPHVTTESREIPLADVVTLDRVICCYPDMEQLVAASASHARHLYGAVFPRERWFLEIFLALGNLVRRMRGNAFRTYVHPIRAIDAALQRQGLTASYVHDTFVWRVSVYSR